MPCVRAVRSDKWKHVYVQCYTRALDTSREEGNSPHRGPGPSRACHVTVREGLKSEDYKAQKKERCVSYRAKDKERMQCVKRYEIMAQTMLWCNLRLSCPSICVITSSPLNARSPARHGHQALERHLRMKKQSPGQ